MITTAEAIRIVGSFEPGGDGLAAKSQELTLGLLRETAAPFSRNQFEPGHLTCTALVGHPDETRVLLMHHHRLRRWLLPGGHIETADTELALTAAREASEETRVRIDQQFTPSLAGVDVHGIPGRRGEPFHLHHDLIWCLRAASAEIEITWEAPAVQWAAAEDWDRLEVAESIRRSIVRAGVPAGRVR